MDDEMTWESASDLRCPVCIQIYSSCTGHASEPIIVCDNMHTMCRTCAAQNSTRSNTCPQCRIKCTDASEFKTNRYILSFLDRFSMRCGSCSLQTKMKYEEITKHSLECPMMRIQCPFPHAMMSQHICRQNLTISTLWDHCRSLHASETHTVECRHDDERGHGVVFSTPVTLHDKQNIFLTLTGEDITALNMCLHVYHVTDDDDRSMVCVALRRFFSENVAKVTRVLLSLEVSDIYGIMLPMSDVIAPHETIMAGDFDQMDSVLRLPHTLLRKMSSNCSSQVKVMMTLQINFDLLGSD